MRTHLAGKTYVYIAVFGTLAVAAMLTSRIELFMLAMPIVLILLALAFEASAPGPSYSIRAELERDRCFEGDTATANVIISAGSNIPLLDLHVMLCDAGNHVLASRHFAIRLKAGETRTFRFTLPMPTRGVFYVGDVVARAYTRSGLKSYGDKVWTGAKCIVYPKPDAVKIDWSVSARSRQHVGESASRMSGDGLEVSDVRLHTPGDPIRRVNWRATLRHGDLYINDSIRDRNIDVVIVIDGLADVGDPPFSYLDAACRAAAGVALAFLRNRDRVGVIRYAGAVDWAVPRPGRNQLYAILDRLARVRTIQSFVAPNMQLIPRAVLPPGSLVLVITPLLDDRSIHMLRGLAARGCRPMVLYISPMGLVEPTRSAGTAHAPRSTFVTGPVSPLASARLDPETDALTERWWRLKHRSKVAQLRSMGIATAEWDGVSSLDACLSRHFRAPGSGGARGDRQNWARGEWL